MWLFFVKMYKVNQRDYILAASHTHFFVKPKFSLPLPGLLKAILSQKMFAKTSPPRCSTADRQCSNEISCEKSPNFVAKCFSPFYAGPDITCVGTVQL